MRRLSRKNRLTFEQRLERFPPILIRLCTRRGRGTAVWCPTDEQIADASGLALAVVKLLTWSLDWEDATKRQIYAFLKGCDVDLEKRRVFRRLEWMRKSGHFRHLHKSPLWETQFRPMVDHWAEHAE